MQRLKPIQLINEETAVRTIEADNLMDFIPAISPGFTSPHHLKPIVDRLEKAHLEPLRLAFSVPPQHHKSQTSLHAIAYWLQQNPKLNILYGTYNQEQANNQIVSAQTYVQRVGLTPDPRMANLKSFRLMEGGAIHARGRESGFTGLPCDIALLDDLIKNLQESQSKAIRDEAFDLLLDVIQNRVHERLSIILFFTRWHEDDPIGRTARHLKDFEIIRIPALADGLDALGKKPLPDVLGRELGEPLLPNQRSKATLEKMRDNPALSRTFWSMQQGLPRDEKTKIFRDVFYYMPQELPQVGFIKVFGMDGAYSAKKSADRSVLIEGRYVPKTEQLFIEKIRIEQMTSDQFIPIVKSAAKTFKVRWRGSGTEKGVAQLARAGFGVNIIFTTLSEDKLANNTAVATDWNKGLVLFPLGADWVTEDLVNEIQGFTGASKERDDVVDALGNIHTLATESKMQTGNTSAPAATASQSQTQIR